MRGTLWLVGAFASATIATGGCSRNVKSDEAMLGHVPMERKQAYFTAQNNLSVAQANVTSAERARKEAEGFRDVSKREYESAKIRLDAAKKTVDLGRQANSPATIEGGQASLNVARSQLEAFAAKRDFAEKLVDLRNVELDAANKRYDIAQNELALTRANAIERAGMRPAEDVRGLRSSRDSNIADATGIDKRAQLLRDEVSEHRNAWNEKRRAYNVASRDYPSAPAVPVPAPPRRVEPAPLPPQ